jgi:spore maturation protein A
MINFLWILMILIGIVVGTLNGKIADVSVHSINSAKEAVTICISMLGVISLWTGLMEIGRVSGLIGSLTKGLHPIIRFVFPDIPQDHIVNEYIASNMIANILGLGWAATPMGLKAMTELKKLNANQDKASIDMCTFLIINISSLQLVPVNIIAYRSQYGSVNPSKILMAAIIATSVSTIIGVIFSVIARKSCKKG